jgi:hypothetical protein
MPPKSLLYRCLLLADFPFLGDEEGDRSQLLVAWVKSRRASPNCLLVSCRPYYPRRQGEFGSITIGYLGFALGILMDCVSVLKRSS